VSAELDAGQVEAQRAKSLLELASDYTRLALQVPEDIETLRAITAELMFEVGLLRHDLRRLGERVETLEKGGDQ
jgi:hypothetical protein